MREEARSEVERGPGQGRTRRRFGETKTEHSRPVFIRETDVELQKGYEVSARLGGYRA